MGLLDSSDDDVKKLPVYKNAAYQLNALEEKLKEYKAKGGDQYVLQSLCLNIKNTLAKIVEGEKQFPDFAGWKTMREMPTELYGALKGKHADSPHVQGLAELFK